ncbi:hypothetical protein BB558_002029, partial [Smittium angustum]
MKLALGLSLLLCIPQAVLSYGVKISKTISIEQLAKNTERINKRGSKNRIVNGVPVEIDEYSSAASIFIDNPDPNLIGECTGVFISQNVVLTAAHCVYNETTGKVHESDITVSGGTKNIIYKTDINNQYSVQNVLYHPDFAETLFDGDIALLILSKNITDPKISFAKIYNFPITDDTPVEAAGWGLTNHDGVSGETEVLRAVPLFISSSNVCAGDYDFWKSNNDSFVCTQSKNGEGTCFGDSGGPLYFTGDENKPIIGITSKGGPAKDKKNMCSETGNVEYFTNAYYFIDWICENTGIDEKDLLYDSDITNCYADDCVKEGPEEEGPGGAGSGEGPGGDGSGEEGPGEDGSGEDGSGEDGSGEDGSGEDGSGEEGPGEDGSGEDGSGEDGSGEDGSGEDGSGEEGPGGAGSGEGPGEDGSGEEGPGEDGSGEDGSGEDGSGEEGPGGAGSGEGPGEDGSGEEGPGEDGSGEDGSGED